MSQGASSLRFGDVICLGLEFSAGSDDEHMFYVLGHRSPLSLVEGCQDVIDNVLIAEIPNTFQSPSDDSITFPVPVHSREYWFEIVGKSEYMMQQMLQKLKMQLERLEADEERMVRSNKQSPSSTSAIERRPSVAAGGGVTALRRRSHDSRHDHDIELSQINVALLADAESPSYDAVSRAPHGGSNLSPALRRRSHDARHDHDIELSHIKSHQLPPHGADSGDFKPESSSQAISRLKSRIADLTDLANGEAQRNLENELSRDGSAVRYGDVIQLRHMSSKKFMTLASGSLSSYELSLGDMNCWFAFEPGFKLSAFGDVINLDTEDKLSVKLVSANSHTEGKVYMALSAADEIVEGDSGNEKFASLSTNLALDGVLEPSRCVPIRTVNSGSAHNRISIFRAGDHELHTRVLDGTDVLSGSSIVRFYYRESDSFLAGRRTESPDEPNKPFLIRAADCTSAKIHDFALTLWFLVDGDGNLSGCGDQLGFGSMVVLQHVVSGLILIAEQNPKYVRPAKRRTTRGMSTFQASSQMEIEKSPTASPDVVGKAQKAWSRARIAVKSSSALGQSKEAEAPRQSPADRFPATNSEPFFNLVLLSLKSVMEAQQSMKGMQLVTRWQFTHPNNAMPGQVSGEISNKSLFLLTSCDCDQVAFVDRQVDQAVNVVIGADQAAAGQKQLPSIGAVVECSDDKIPEFLFNVEFISPRMLEFVEKPRSVVFILYTFFTELKACASQTPIEKGSPAHTKLCAFIDKFGERVESGFEIFARLCCSDSKDQISSVPLERLIFEAPNRKMQLFFGQLGAVSLIGSLIQTLQLVWKGQDNSSNYAPSYPADVSQVLEDSIYTALIAFVCLCSGCPENKQSVSPDMLGLLSEQLLPIQTLSDIVVRAMVALSAENQSVVLKTNKKQSCALKKIHGLLKEQRRSTFVDFLSSFLIVNDVPVSEYQRILLHTVFLPDASCISDGNPQESFFPRVKFFPWKFSNEDRLSCHIMMDHVSDWGIWPLKDGKTNLIQVLWDMKKNPLPSKISLGKFEYQNDIMTFQFQGQIDPSTKSSHDIERMSDQDLKLLVASLCTLRIQYLCSLYCLVASLCHGRNAVCRKFFLNAYKYSSGFTGVDGTQSSSLHVDSSSIIPDFNILVLGVVEDKMPAAFKNACVQLLHSFYVSNDPWTEKDILPHVIVDKCFPLTDSRQQSILVPAHHLGTCISFEKMTDHLKDSSNVSIEQQSRNLAFHSAPNTVDFPFNFAELNGHHYFEIQVSSDPSAVISFEIGFIISGSQAQAATHKLMWSSAGTISGVVKCKHSNQIEPIEDVTAPSIRHGNIVGCGISDSNQFYFTLNQRVFFLYKDESRLKFSAACCRPIIIVHATPFAIMLKDVDVAPVDPVSLSESVDAVVQPPQHSAMSTTISKGLLLQSQNMQRERDRMKNLLQQVEIPLKENDILANLFGSGCEDAKLMMQSLCKLVESVLRTQIDESASGYGDIILIMRSCVSIFKYLSLTFYQQDYPKTEGEDEEKEKANRSDSDEDDHVSDTASSSSSSSSSSSQSLSSKPMSDEQWFAIFEKGSSTNVLLYACSLLNTLFDLFTKRRIEVFSNYVQNNSTDVLSMTADALLKVVASDDILVEAQSYLPDLEKFLHVACRCPNDVVKSVVLKLLFEHQSFESCFIRSLIPVIFVDTVPPANSNTSTLSGTQNALANTALSMERVTKQIRLSEPAVRGFLEDPSFDHTILEPLAQLLFAVEDLMSLILPQKVYFDSLHTFLINDMASPCELLFSSASLSRWTGTEYLTVDPTPNSARVLAEYILNSENARFSLDSVLPESGGVIDDDVLHRVGAMFIASEVDQAIMSILGIGLSPKGDILDKTKPQDFSVAVSIVESIFLRMMEALCAAAKLSRDCRNELSGHTIKLLALASSDNVLDDAARGRVAHRGSLRSGAAKVLFSLLHENTSLSNSLHSDNICEIAKSSFLYPEHDVILFIHSILRQRDYQSQKVHHFSSNQSLVFHVMTEAIGADKSEFLLLDNSVQHSGPFQKCFDQDSVQLDAKRATRRHPTFLLHVDVVRSISACLRGNNFTKASIASMIPLSKSFLALSRLLSKPLVSNPSSISALVSLDRGAAVDAHINMAAEWASSCVIYYCEMIAHAHLISSHQPSVLERTDDIPFATENGLLPVLGDFVSAATQVIKPLSVDSNSLGDVSDSSGFMDALLGILSSPSHYSGALAFMSLAAGKIADHCLNNKSNAAAIPLKFEDFLRIINQAENSDEVSRKFALFQSSITTLVRWKIGHPVFFSLSAATLSFLMHKYHSDLASFTTGQLNLAFNEVVKSVTWVQRASVQILPAFLVLYASTFLPPLHPENRKFVVEMGEKLDILDKSYNFATSKNDYSMCFVRSNILKRAVSLFAKDGVYSWLSPKRHIKQQSASLTDDTLIAAIFENHEFFDDTIPIKVFIQLQDTLLPEMSFKKSSFSIARRGSVVISDFTVQNFWEDSVRKLSIKNKLGISYVSDCISDGTFEIAFALAESGLPMRKESEAQRLDRLEAEAIHALQDSQGRGCLVQTRVWIFAILKLWKLFTYSLSMWIFDFTKSVALVGYRIVARVADLLGLKGILLMSSVEAFLEGHSETNLDRLRFLEMDLRYKRILLKVNHNDFEDPNSAVAVKFSDASPPALVHSLIKSISVMEHAKALVSLGDAEREAMLDQFFLQALHVLRLHLYTSPSMTKAEAKMRAQAFNLKIPIVNALSSNSWIFRLNLVQNFLVLGHSGTDEDAVAAASNHSASHQELLSALIHLSLTASPNPETRVAAIECLSCLFCGCSRQVLEVFDCHPIVQSPANAFFLSLAEAFESFRTSANSRSMYIQKYSDIYVSFESGLNRVINQNVEDVHAEPTVDVKFLALLKAEVQRRIHFDISPQTSYHSIFSAVSEGITFIFQFVIGPDGEDTDDIDTTEAPVFVRMLLRVIPLRRIRDLFQFLLSRFGRSNSESSASRSMKEIAVIASKRIFSEGFDLFNACNSLTRNLLVSPASFQANVSFQESLISQEKHADLSNNVDVSTRILGIIIQSLDAMQSGNPNMLDSFTVVNCYVNLQKFCFGQNRKVIYALTKSSFLTVYNRTITVMLSIFSYLNQKTGEEAAIFLDGFHPIDIIMSLILLLRNLCTSDTDNVTCPKVYSGISWNNLFKLSNKIAEYYKLNGTHESSTSRMSIPSLADAISAIREVFSNLLPHSESSSDVRRQGILAREVLAGVFALKETVAYHSPKESPVPSTLAKLFSEHALDTLPMFSGPSSQICRIEVVRRDGKAELMFFQRPEELDGIEIDAGDLMPIRDSHGESLRSHLVEAERMRLSVIAKQAFGAKFFRKFDYVPLFIGTLINLMLILFLALKVNDGEYFDDNVKHPDWKIPLQLNWDNFVNVMTWQPCEENCNLEDNPFAKIVPNIFTNIKDGGGGDTFVGSQCAEFDPILNATEYNTCFKFPYSDQTQRDAAVAIGITFLVLAFMNILATASNLLSWLYYSSNFVVRETVLDIWYRDCKENSKPMFFAELESQFTNADSFKIIIRNWTFWWLIMKCAAAVLSLLVHPIIAAILTIDAFRIKQVDYIFSAFTVKGKEFITLFLLISAIIYLNAVFGIVFYWDQMANWSLQCSSLFQCTVSFFIVGWTGSIGDLMDAPEDDLGYPKYSDFRGTPGTPLSQGDGRLMFRLIWQLMFFIAVPTCLISVVTGIIIDSFTEIRQSINERREKLENSCFVCDISSDVWRKVALDMSTTGQRGDGLNFPAHVNCEHNILDYFSIFFRVRCASSTAHFTDQEHDLRRRFNQLDFTVFPMDQALSLARAVDNNASDDIDRVGNSNDLRLSSLENSIKQLIERLKEHKVPTQPNASEPLNSIREE